MERDLKALIKQMTLEEKAGMCSGEDFWHLKGIKRLGIPSVMVSDGPHGLRKQDETGDHLGINDSIQAVCFPAACATAASFDRDLLHTMGEALGESCRAEGISVLLGPAVNIKRSPLCGRNFEYFSEDPYLTGELAASFIEGVQKWEVGTSIKHFAVNNQEYYRLVCSSEVDERTLREIYLAGFEKAITKAKPWTVMCSYNKINGIFASEDKKLLNDILREEWGFEGYVMSDWGAVNDRVAGLKAGLELEMPACGGVTDKLIVEAVRVGELEESILDQGVERLLKQVFRYTDHRQEAHFDKDKQHSLASKLEEECAVLLKNEEDILPLLPSQRVAFIGEFATKPRFQGGGSSHVNAYKIENAKECSEKLGARITYAKGFSAEEDLVEDELIEEAVKCAKEAEVAVIFAGLPDAFESEGYDRKHMRLPECQNRLIEKVLEVQSHTVVVLHNGSPVELPWADQVAGILEMYLGGQGVGAATAALLYGKANPCGRLPESFPLKLEDNPSYLNFPGNGEKVVYNEGIFVGYRYYDTKKMAVRYPFGYGLSYTTFDYSHLQIEKKTMSDEETITVKVDITNSGKRAGKEVIQLYIRDLTGTVGRAEKELKDFVKVALQPGETKTVCMHIDYRALAWYNETIQEWYAASGPYKILIGRSSRDIVLQETINFTTTKVIPFHIDSNTTIGKLLEDVRTRAVVQKAYTKYMEGQEVSDIAQEAINSEMAKKLLEEAPLRNLRTFAHVEQPVLDKMIEYLNTLVQ